MLIIGRWSGSGDNDILTRKTPLIDTIIVRQTICLRTIRSSRIIQFNGIARDFHSLWATTNTHSRLQPQQLTIIRGQGFTVVPNNTSLLKYSVIDWIGTHLHWQNWWHDNRQSWPVDRSNLALWRRFGIDICFVFMAKLKVLLNTFRNRHTVMRYTSCQYG